MKLAYFSPLPPQKTGISNYSEALVRRLQEHAQIDLWVSGFRPVLNLSSPVKAINYHPNGAVLKRLEAYDLVVYHMGNNVLYHDNIFEVLIRQPGLVVLHDYCLLDFFLGYYTRNLHNPEGFVELMAAEYGAAGRSAALGMLLPGLGTRPDPLDFPLNGPVLRNALGVVVHSRFVHGLTRKTHVDVPLRWINLGTETPDHKTINATDMRKKYRLPERKFLIGCFGFVVPSKRLDVLFRALAHSSIKERLLVLVVGQDAIGVQDLAESCGAKSFVRHIDFVSTLDFDALINVVDVCVNLRYPTMGETSGSLCRALALGKPAVVSNVGWYAELPDDCVIKTPVDLSEEAAVREAVEKLAGDAGLRRRMGEKARAYMQSTHSWKASARQYLGFMSDIVSGKALVQMALARDIGEALREIGLTPSDRQALQSIAACGVSLFGPSE